MQNDVGDHTKHVTNRSIKGENNVHNRWREPIVALGSKVFWVVKAHLETKAPESQPANVLKPNARASHINKALG